MITSKKYIEIPKLFFGEASDMIERNDKLYKDVRTEFAILDTIVDFENEKDSVKIKAWKNYYRFENSKLVTYSSPKMQVFHFKQEGFPLAKEELIIEETILETYSSGTQVELLVIPNKRIELFDELVMNIEL
jgi:hypothetical protein